MKIKLTFILLMISAIAFADSGGGYGTKCNVNDIEINYNLFYTSVDGDLSVINKKGKEEKYYVTSNISIYDINTGKISYLFSDTLNEKICEFYFESYYDSLNKQIVFNQSNNDYPMNNIIGNFNLKNRLPGDKIFIITYSYKSDKYSLWTAHKNGTQLTRVYEFSKEVNYFFDVKNMVIRFIRQAGKKIEIKDHKY